MSGRIHHMSLDVRGCLKNWKPSDMRGMFSRDDGRPMSADEAKAELIENLANGVRFLPIGGACEGFDRVNGGCPGHARLDDESTVMSERVEG